MNDKQFNRFWLFSCLGVLAASFYPLYMGARVVSDMITSGEVLKENYPKYIIPYTPICIALLIGVLIIPLCIKLFKRFALLSSSAVSVSAFFAAETLFERKVVVTSTETTATLADWQMFLCRYVSPEEFAGETITQIRTETPVDILIGEYNPAFKLHFYIISVVIILSLLNCFYGFAQIIKANDKKRFSALILQLVSSIAFLGLCILACFTAFWRDGSIMVSPLSAALMAVFFILLGLTVGIYTGSFLLGKPEFISVAIPSIASSLSTFLMYVGEMILLHGHLYQLGTGFLFERIPYLPLAPVDIFIIMISGFITALIFKPINKSSKARTQSECGLIN